MFTSSFSMKKSTIFGWRGVVTLAVLVVLHHLLSVGWSRPNPKAASQWGQNLIASESVVYDATAADCVLVGTSLTASFQLDRDASINGAPRFFNLAYAGGSLSTGLSLIQATGQVPRCVVVETNFLGSLVDQSHLDMIFHPVWQPLKKAVPGLKHENQPLNMLLTAARSFSGQRVAPPKLRKPPDRSNDPVYQLRLREKLDFLDLIPAQQVQDQAQHLGNVARSLASSGSKIFLLQMPVAAEIEAHPHYGVVKNALELQNLEQLPNVDLVNIQTPGLVTTDGIHLDRASQQVVESELLDAVMQRLAPSNKLAREAEMSG